jgi:hypothetical protein
MQLRRVKHAKMLARDVVRREVALVGMQSGHRKDNSGGVQVVSGNTHKSLAHI